MDHAVRKSSNSVHSKDDPLIEFVNKAEYLRRVNDGLKSADRGEFVSDDEMGYTFTWLTADN
jgi:predicted transcriptional regulator